MSALSYYQRGLATEARCRELVDKLVMPGSVSPDDADVLEGWFHRTFVQPELTTTLIDRLLERVEDAIDEIESIHIETGKLYKLQGELENLRAGRME